MAGDRGTPVCRLHTAEKIAWPRRDEAGDGRPQPGVLTVACEGSRALFLTHAQGELISRINSFFGFAAIRQLRIVQKPVAPQPKSRPLRPLDAIAASKLDDMVDGMEDGRLKEAIHAPWPRRAFQPQTTATVTPVSRPEMRQRKKHFQEKWPPVFRPEMRELKSKGA